MGKYKHAPITEALWEVNVEPSVSNIKEINFEQINVQKQFPLMEEKFFFDKKNVFRSDSNKYVDGYLYKSEDKSEIIQYRLDGYTFNKLKPYSKWEVLFPVFEKYWQKYKDFVKPKKIKKIAVRYINVIPIIEEYKKLEDYFVNPIGLPETLCNKDILHLFSKYVIKLEDAFNAIVIKNISNNSLILDIEVFKELNIDLNKDYNFINDFEKMRVFKNNIFEESLTNKIKRKVK